MTAMTLDPRIDTADRILRECGDERTWPKARSPWGPRARKVRHARAALAWAKASLAEALDTHARFLNGCMSPVTGMDAEALDAAADIAEDEAARLEKLHRRHVRREEAARGNAA